MPRKLTRHKPSLETKCAISRKKVGERGKARHAEAIAAYYDSLSEDKRDQNRAWGEFAEHNFPSSCPGEE